MADYLRKPAPGTDRREDFDRAHKRKLCSCGSRRFRHHSTQTCIACDPNTKDRFAALMHMQKGSKQ